MFLSNQNLDKNKKIFTLITTLSSTSASPPQGIIITQFNFHIESIFCLIMSTRSYKLCSYKTCIGSEFCSWPTSPILFKPHKCSPVPYHRTRRSFSPSPRQWKHFLISFPIYMRLLFAHSNYSVSILLVISKQKAMIN